MRILILGTDSSSQNTDAYYSEYVRFFQDALSRRTLRADVSFALFQDLIISVGEEGFTIQNAQTNDELSTYDLIVLRGTGFRGMFDVLVAISTYARMHNLKIINDYSDFRDSSKLLQAVRFYEEGIPVAQTVYVTDAVLKAPDLPISLPCILKATFGAHGNDNHVVRTLDEIKEIVSAKPSVAYVLQRFVPNDRDFRLLLVGDDLLVIERRAAAGTHLNNTSQGGSAQLVPAETLPAQAVADARKIVQRLNMTIAGVDILYDQPTGAYYFLEVNSQPQLMSGAFVEEKTALVGKYLSKIADDKQESN